MRAIRLVTVAVCLALIGGCQAQIRHSDGEAGPAGQLEALPSQASSSPSGRPTASTATAATTRPANSTLPARTPLTLGPNGIGALKLGMTRTQAEATGLVAKFQNEPNSRLCLWRTRLVGAHGDGGIVFHSETLGVATIDAFKGIKTPEGVKIGSSVADVRRAYPGFSVDPEISRGYVTVPGNSKAVYRISVDNGVVNELTLQLRDQNCYE